MSDPTYVIRPTQLTVYLKGGDAFDESAITVTAVDEGAGEFIRVHSLATSETTNGQISMDFACLDAIKQAADILRKGGIL